jgi:L-threonylcarbamoyladenylate synthase
MLTRRLTAAAADIQAAADLLRAGEVVAIPTETVYGLAGAALNPAAVARIFVAKGRPADDPLIVHLATVDDLPLVARAIPPAAAALAQAFWPGPLTLILPRTAAIADAVTAGRDSVAVRIPNHPTALAVLRAAGVPLAAPSANRFGHTSPTSAEHVLADLDGRIAAVIDAGATPHGVESTIIDCTETPPRLLRPGALTLEQVEACIGPINRPPLRATAGPQAAPGLLDRHYAPDHDLWLYDGPSELALPRLAADAAAAFDRGLTVALLLCDEDLDACDLPVARASLGPRDRPAIAAQRLFDALRRLEQLAPDLMFARTFAEDGLGRALNDRLRRAAARRISETDTPS